jgi:hypothetical protein
MRAANSGASIAPTLHAKFSMVRVEARPQIDRASPE